MSLKMIGYGRSAWGLSKTVVLVKGECFIVQSVHHPTEASRFAFVDFTSIEHATAALINHRNHRLNGRDLVVEYASADAVRRGGGSRLQNHEHKSSSGKRNTARQHDAKPQSQSRPRPRRNDDEKEHRARNDESLPRRNFQEAPSHTKVDRSRGRPKPGAALAQAPRESAAIIPSQGQKIVF